MTKKDKSKNSTKNKKESDLVEFLFNNAGTFKKGFNDVMVYGKNIWDVLPEIMYNIFYSVYEFMEKVVLRLRSHFALKLNDDMKHLDVDKKLWEYLMERHAGNKLTRTIKKCKSSAKTDKEKDYFNLIGHYVKTDKKDGFLSCCITMQNNTHFITARNKLIMKMNKSTNDAYTESYADTNINTNTNGTSNGVYYDDGKDKSKSYVNSDVYSKDIFTPISNKLNDTNLICTHKKLKKQNDSYSDVVSTARIVSVVKKYDKIRKTDKKLD